MKYLHARKSRQDVEINIVYQTKVSRATLHELVRYGPALALWLAREKCQGICGSRLPLLAPGRISPVGDKPFDPALVSPLHTKHLEKLCFKPTIDCIERWCTYTSITFTFQSLSVACLYAVLTLDLLACRIFFGPKIVLRINST